MKQQQVMPISSTWPALSRLALVQTRVGPSVMRESRSVSDSSTPRYWGLRKANMYSLEKATAHSLLLCREMLSRGGARGKPLFWS